MKKYMPTPANSLLFIVAFWVAFVPLISRDARVGIYPFVAQGFPNFGAIGFSFLLFITVLIFSASNTDRSGPRWSALIRVELNILIPTSVLVVGFLVAALFSDSQRPSDIVSIAAQYFFCLFLVFYFSNRMARDKLNAVAMGYIFGVLFLALYAIIAYLLQYDAAAQMGWIRRNGRLELWMGPLTISVHFLLSFIFFTHFIGKIPKYANLLLVPISLIFFTAIFLTGSNFAIITFVVLSAVAIYKQSKFQFLIAASFGALVALPILLSVVSDPSELAAARRFNWILEGDLSRAGSYEERLLLNELAIQLISMRPLLGYGPGTYTVAVSSLGSSIQQVHNAFLLIWAEGGFFAWCASIFWFIALFHYSAKGKNRQDRFFLIVMLLCIFLVWNQRTHAYQAFLYLPLAFMIGSMREVKKGLRD